MSPLSEAAALASDASRISYDTTTEPALSYTPSGARPRSSEQAESRGELAERRKEP